MAAKALARSGAETFLISQGAARFIFHVAGLVLWLLPGIGASGGSAANLLQAQYEMRPTRDYAVAIAAIPAAAAAAAVAGLALCRGLAALLHRLGRDRVSTAALLAMAAGTLALYGWAGIGVLAVASAIGVLAALLGARRENCFAVVLLPMACELSGIGPDVALWLGME
jgi:TctA family transporter